MLADNISTQFEVSIQIEVSTQFEVISTSPLRKTYVSIK